MGTYKVLQDIEAEDKLLGPLTLKQFIFAIIAATCVYLSFLALTHGVGILAIFLLPPIAIFGILAWPWSKEQTTEVWLLAKLRFFIKPRKRIWDQNGIKDVVTITAPVLEKKEYSDGLSQGEVKSRLHALANTIDSRGWAVKNVNVSLGSAASYPFAADSDRLISPSTLPQQVVNTDINAADDILDEQNNPTAQNLDRMISATSTARRQQIVEQMRQGTPQSIQQPADYWFMNQPSGPIPTGQVIFDGSTTVLPGSPSSDPFPSSATMAALADLQMSQQGNSFQTGNMRTLPVTGAAPPQPSSKTPDPVILELANNDDLNVATIARQANKAKGLGDDEVIISLH